MCAQALGGPDLGKQRVQHPLSDEIGDLVCLLVLARGRVSQTRRGRIAIHIWGDPIAALVMLVVVKACVVRFTHTGPFLRH